MVEEVIKVVDEFGYPVVMSLGMGYFIYFIWKYVTEELEPRIEKQKISLIRLIDQMRMLDQDQIRLQQKLNTVLEYRKAERLRKKLRNEKPDKVIKS
jgi:hypothetical protein|tara:strand:- start:226 stop:516 length:291 start_codon:yes stop_codon:yes gene_type:complete